MQAREYRKRAWESLRNNYWMMLVGIIVVSAIVAFANVVSIVIVGTLMVGLNIYFINANAGKEADVIDIFEPFKDQFTNTLVTYIIKHVFLILWSFLFVIPGIVKSYSYFLVEYLLVYDKELKGQDAITKSRELMDGNKGRLFLIHLSFIGWIILGVLTLGIGLIFLTPYIKMTEVQFALDLLKEANIIDDQNIEIVEVQDEYITNIND